MGMRHLRWGLRERFDPCKTATGLGYYDFGKAGRDKKLFRRTIDTGIEHGTVTVLFGKDSFEVTTYRIDGAYEDSRHPKEVQFTNRLEEDLKRRDFTINAMAYNDQVRLVDVFGGMQDLNHHLIRCVGDPEERFFGRRTEDSSCGTFFRHS